ncbi:MAG TPA: sulfotransferase [Kofleriaceae bacterium]|nr:sulfotransferase [Kofleriaceae bacterium]
MGESAPTPVLVVGTARGGTTWLTNLLAAHPQIVTPQHEAHWGAVECRMFQLARHAGDITDDRRFIEFVEMLASSDLFRLLGGQKQRLYATRRPHVYEIMLDLLDGFAREGGASHWVTKLDPEFLYYPAERAAFFSLLDARYPRVKVVGITREASAVLRSYLKMEGARSIHRLGAIKKRAALILECARYAVHMDAIEHLVTDRGGLMISFSDLKGDYAVLRRRLEQGLGLAFADQRPTNRYPANTSHIADRATDDPLRLERRLAELALIPAFRSARGAAVGMLRMRDATRPQRAPFDWRLLRLEHMRDSLEKELARTGQSGLSEILFDARSHGRRH